MEDDIGVMVEIMADSYGNATPTFYAGVKLNGKICTDADGPTLEYALLLLIKHMGAQIIELDPFFSIPSLPDPPEPSIEIKE